MKTSAAVLLGLYVLTLLWLTLFKLSYDISSIVADHQTRSLSLVPFKTEVLDWVIIAVGTILFVAFILLRTLVLHVRY